MAEFHFYAIREDRPRLLMELVGKEGMTWFRSGNYTTPVPEALNERNVNAVADTGQRQFYGLPDPRGRFPSMAVRVSGDAAGSWYINVNESPPMVVCILPPHFEENGWRLGDGNVYYPATGPASDSESRQRLQPVYADVVKLLKNHLHTKTIEGKRVWLTSGAIDFIQKGALVLVDGKWVGAPGRVDDAH